MLKVDQDGHIEEIKAVAIIAFEERGDAQVYLRMFDNQDIPEEWWRLVIKSMYDGLDKAMADRRETYKAKP
ncbi:MAG: hypothetical protein Q8P59_05770 [Dehalococcoidia bacterium]|nr:hypothetical protein [Dehalococcoidia bacterium]